MIKRLIKHRLTQNAAGLYCVHIANIILPLVTVPFLARTLKAESWGTVALSQAVAVYLTMIVGYGFNSSGTREVACNREDPKKLSEIVAGVVGAKLLLSLVATLVAVVVQLSMPIFRHNYSVYYWGTIWGIAQGLGSVWFFQGIEDLRVASITEISCRIVSVVAVFCLVRSPKDGYLTLVAFSAGSLLADIIEMIRMYRSVAFVFPTWLTTKNALKMSWAWFLYESGVTLYTTTGSVIIGVIAGPASVAFYSSADRIIRVVRVTFEPLLRTVFPKVSRLAHQSIEEGRLFVGRFLILSGAMSSILSIFIFVNAPRIVHLVLGAGYTETVPLLRLLAPLPPLYTIASVLGNNWAYPLGMDSLVNRVMLLASFVNIGLGLVLVRIFGVMGMAMSVLFCQAGVVALYWLLLLRRGWQPRITLLFNGDRLRQGVIGTSGPIPSKALPS